MGLLRFLLAICVVLSHTTRYGNGPVAVEAFFIISGFYITLILNEKYINGNNSYWLFISNRFLRLFPLYWTVLLLTLLCALLIPGFNAKAHPGGLEMYKEYGHNLSFTTYFYLIFTNICIFFQDTSLFLGISLHTGNLYYTHDFRITNPPVWQFELLTQAWSISLELIFYLIAPFILRKKWGWIIVAIIGSMLLKIYGSTHNYGNDPWNYRFFPFELMYFLLGSVAYLFYKNVIKKVQVPRIINIGLLSIVAGYTVFYSVLHFKYVYELYILCVFSFMPFLFKYTKDIKIDRFIGELSYPIYITHVLMMNLSRTAGVKHLAIPTILGSIIASIILIKFLGDKIERVRQARVKSGKGVSKVSNALSPIIYN
ncbi:MAG: hypothetical protein JWR67_1674 [Mucilaginibacter sp.]|nr:hypothetical protein [Mucilaginibacter sp.]